MRQPFGCEGPHIMGHNQIKYASSEGKEPLSHLRQFVYMMPAIIFLYSNRHSAGVEVAITSVAFAFWCLLFS